MAEVAKVDDRGRVKLPRGTAKAVSSVVIIDSGAYFLCIPIPRDPLQASASWLKSDKSTKEMKRMAEAEARRDALSRAKRRGQLA